MYHKRHSHCLTESLKSRTAGGLRSEALRANRDFVLRVVARCGRALQHAAEALRYDREVPRRRGRGGRDLARLRDDAS